MGLGLVLVLGSSKFAVIGGVIVGLIASAPHEGSIMSKVAAFILWFFMGAIGTFFAAIGILIAILFFSGCC